MNEAKAFYSQFENKKEVTLSTPIKRGEKEITTLVLTEPNYTALKGVKMFDLLQSDVEAVGKILPRISEPSLTSAEIAKMSAKDFLKISVAVATFFTEEGE